MNNPKSILVIFAKNPVKGNVKTRLAASIGHDAALAVYKKLLDVTYQAVRPFDGEKCIFFADEINSKMWNEFPKLMQRGDSLGERMQNAIQDCMSQGFEKMVIIGTDLPDLSPDLITRAFQVLDDQDVVLGPSVDGGYYLIGVNAMYPFLFENKSWSTDKLLEETIDSLNENHVSYGVLSEKNDIDTLDDLNNSSLEEYFHDVIENKKLD